MTIKVFEAISSVKAAQNRRPQATQIGVYCINTHQFAFGDYTRFGAESAPKIFETDH